MKRIVRIGTISLAVAFMSLSGGSAMAMSWSDLLGGSSSGPSRQSAVEQKVDNEHPCLRFTNHEYEVCSAYIANASLAVLATYYKYANTNDAWSRYVTYRLGSRYTGNAFDQIHSRVASWPAGKNDVDVPRLEILSVNSSLVTDTATLVTRESWRVKSSDETVIYQEADQQHTITMQRVPSYVLHKWVVNDIK